jgi:hypothetical protein
MLTKEQIYQNEIFFLSVIINLSENGTYVFPAAMASFTKKNNRLIGTKENLLHVKYIVSPEFFHTYFQAIELN